MASNDERSGKKVLTMAEVQQLAADTSKCIMVINNHVYDITRFMDEHPGGEEVLKEQHGRDASDAFEDVGHSVDAREQMKSYEIGELDPNDAKTKTKPKPTISNSNSGSSGAADDSSSWTKWVIPLVIAVAAVVLFKLLTKSGPEVPRPPPAI